MTQEQFLQEFRTHDAGRGFRAKIPFSNGALEASIVAGEYFYSTPRQDMDSQNDYTAFEVAFFEMKDGEHVWASYKTLEDAGVFAIVGYGEYESTEESKKTEPGCNVFGWVATEKILQVLSK